MHESLYISDIVVIKKRIWLTLLCYLYVILFASVSSKLKNVFVQEMTHPLLWLT